MTYYLGEKCTCRLPCGLELASYCGKWMTTFKLDINIIYTELSGPWVWHVPRHFYIPTPRGPTQGIPGFVSEYQYYAELNLNWILF